MKPLRAQASRLVAQEMTATIDQAITAESLRSDESEPTYSGVQSFLRRKYSKELDDVDIAVVGIPLDLATSNRPGARFGPSAVRNASALSCKDFRFGLFFR